MSDKKSSKKSVVLVTPSNRKSKKESAMKKKKISEEPVVHVTPTVEVAAEAAPEAAGTTPAAPPAAAPLPLVFLNPPPASANIPSPPAGFVPPKGGQSVGMRPRLTELAALPLALGDLRNFADYADAMGKAAPPLAYVQQAFTVGNQWSTMRAMSAAWDAYCNNQAALAWTSIRALMDRLRPAFELAATADPTLLTRFPNLAAFLSARKVIAAKAVSTKRADKLSAAKGEPTLHGATGKAKKRKAAKAALAATTATPPTPAGAPAPSTQPQPASPLASPLPATPAPVPAPSPVTNGASH